VIFSCPANLVIQGPDGQPQTVTVLDCPQVAIPPIGNETGGNETITPPPTNETGGGEEVTPPEGNETGPLPPPGGNETAPPGPSGNDTGGTDQGNVTIPIEGNITLPENVTQINETGGGEISTNVTTGEPIEETPSTDEEDSSAEGFQPQ